MAFNYYGSALIRSGKPIIFFCTTRQVPVSADLFHLSGTVVRKPEEFWSVVRNFFTDSAFAKQMCLKAQGFYGKNLHDRDYPNIGEIVDRILSRQNTTVLVSMVGKIRRLMAATCDPYPIAPRLAKTGQLVACVFSHGVVKFCVMHHRGESS